MRTAPSLTAIVLIATVAALLLPSASVGATIIVENTAGDAVSRIDEYVGQSVTTPAGVGWNDILFSFLKEETDGTITSLAEGALFLFSTEYLGDPVAMDSSGYMAKSTGISSGAFGDKYIFASSVVLLPNTKYYFYSDYLFSGADLQGGDTYVGGDIYFGAGGYFEKYDTDNKFRLEGTPVPEPATMLLLGSGLVGLVGFRKKFRK